MLKLHTVNSDGSTNDRSQVVVAVRHPDTGLPMEGVTVTVRPATQREWREIQRRHTRKERNPATRAFEPVTDDLAATDELLSRSILSWAGIVGADDKPLPVVPAAVERLDPRVKLQCFEAIMGAEYSDPPEVRDASFREPA